MALLVLNNDITNAHHLADDAIPELVRDCLVIRVGGHEAQAVYECRRGYGPDQVPHSFHVVTAIPSNGHDFAEDARERSRKEK